jgi:glycogen debranching enzyme
LCELFDGDAPQRPGGAIASARSVGEILRAYVEGVLDQGPKGSGSAAQSIISTNPGVVTGRRRV